MPCYNKNFIRFNIKSEIISIINDSMNASNVKISLIIAYVIKVKTKKDTMNFDCFSNQSAKLCKTFLLPIFNGFF